jgi:hypothetical protein
MRLALLSTASLAAIAAFAMPAAAGPDFTGVGQVFVGVGTTDGSFFAGKTLDDPFLYGVKGKGLWPLSPDVHLQADLFVDQSDDQTKSWSSEGDATTIGGALHLLHPFENRARFGLAGSVWSNEVYVPAGNGQADLEYGLVALEGQVFGTDWTAMGQIGLFTSFSCSDGGEGCPGAFNDGNYVRGKLRYFLSDNTVLSVEALQMWGTLRDDNNFFGGKKATGSYGHWVFDVEHRFADSCFSGVFTLTHERSEADVFFSASADTSSAMLSLKFYYDQPTVRSNDRSGAEMDTPTFGNSLETMGVLAISASP